MRVLVTVGVAIVAACQAGTAPTAQIIYVTPAPTPLMTHVTPAPTPQAAPTAPGSAATGSGPSAAPPSARDAAPPTAAATLGHIAWEHPAVKPWRSFSGDASWPPPGTEYPGLQPPLGLLVAEWHLTPRAGFACMLHLTVTDESLPGLLSGASLLTDGREDGIDLIKVTPDARSAGGTSRLAVSADCPWELHFAELGTVFGPDSRAVADFIWRSNQLGPDWDSLTRAVQDAARDEARSQIAALAHTDPNIGLALQRALSEDWYRGNRYIEADLVHRQAREDAISALVVRSVFPAAIGALYQPFEQLIPADGLGR